MKVKSILIFLMMLAMGLAGCLDDDDSDSDDSSDYSSTDSEDDDENSENRQACRRIFDHIDADGSGLVELDEVLDSWQQCTTVR